MHICHLAVLNTAQHVRICYKWALTQAHAGHRVSVIAQDPAPAPYAFEGVEIVPLRPFRRMSLARLLARGRIWRLAAARRADVYFIHTPELLGVARRLRQAQGCRIVYDMHEDYRETILAAGHYPPWLRAPLAAWVRRRERRAVGWLHAVVYAEACYDNVLGAPPSRCHVIPNWFSARAAQGAGAAAQPARPAPLHGQPYLLYTGTIAREWGVLDAIELWLRMRALRPVGLVIAGFTYDTALLAHIRARIAGCGHAADVELIGGETYVPYPDILALMRGCVAVLGLYLPLPFIRHKMPTKFFEALAMGRPVLFRDAPYWAAQNAALHFGIGLDAAALHDPAQVWAALEARQGHPPTTSPATYLWEQNAAHVLRVAQP